MNKYIGFFGVVFILLLVALIVLVILPTTNNFSNCFSVAIGETKQMLVPPQISQNEFCKNGQEMILSLDSCITNVKKQNVFAPALYQLAFILFNADSVNNAISKHNQVCPQYSAPYLIN